MVLDEYERFYTRRLLRLSLLHLIARVQASTHRRVVHCRPGVIGIVAPGSGPSNPLRVSVQW